MGEKMKKIEEHAGIQIPIYYHEDGEGNKVYDYESMAEEFENELSKIVGVTVMCSVSEDVVCDD